MCLHAHYKQVRTHARTYAKEIWLLPHSCGAGKKKGTLYRTLTSQSVSLNLHSGAVSIMMTALNADFVWIMGWYILIKPSDPLVAHSSHSYPSNPCPRRRWHNSKLFLLSRIRPSSSQCRPLWLPGCPGLFVSFKYFSKWFSSQWNRHHKDTSVQVSISVAVPSSGHEDMSLYMSTFFKTILPLLSLSSPFLSLTLSFSIRGQSRWQ